MYYALLVIAEEPNKANADEKTGVGTADDDEKTGVCTAYDGEE